MKATSKHQDEMLFKQGTRLLRSLCLGACSGAPTTLNKLLILHFSFKTLHFIIKKGLTAL